MAKFVYLFLAFLVTSPSHGKNMDLFSSMSEMQGLYDKEQDLTVKLENHLKTVEHQIKTLDKLLTKYYDNYNYTEEDATEYVSHPINTYVLLKRTSLEWPKVKKVLFDEKSEKELEELLEAMESFPGEDELEGALNGIFLLHETYDLNLTAFSLGQVEVPGQKGNFLQSDHQLYAKDLELLGKLAFNRGFYDRAYEFLKTAEWRAVKDNDKETLVAIKSSLKTIIRGHDEVLLKKGPRGATWKTYQIPFDKEHSKKKKFRNIPLKYSPKPILKKYLSEHELWDQFNALCRGEKMRTPEEEKNLTSFYLHFGDPYLRLGPFKVEVLSHSPFSTIFHDFMSNDEVETYIRVAKDNLHRSEHMNNRGGMESSVKRTSKQTWFTDDKDLVDTMFTKEAIALKEAIAISNRISLATRMNVFQGRGGEPYQVANYGIGGVYNHHTDAAGEQGEGQVEPKEHGDRVATFMAYLSDVTAGGATVFPSAGVTAWPKKGNAIFWYNLDRNGNLDRVTYHGGCPVLKGSKWITNKWIRWYFQQKSFPCTLSVVDMDRFKPLSNNLCDMTDRCKAMDI